MKEEPFQELWSFIEFNLASKYAKWLRITSGIITVVLCCYFVLAFKLCPQPDFKFWSYLLLMLPMIPGNILLAVNYFSYILSVKEVPLIEIKSISELLLPKSSQDAENFKRTWCMILIWLTLYIGLALFLNHPAFVDSQKWEIYKFDERPSYYKFLTFLLTSFGFPLLPIWLYKLCDYIDNKLSKNYESMTVVDLELEQNAITDHLKQCARFHLLLRNTLTANQKQQNVIFLIYCPLIAMSVVTAIFCIVANINRDFRMYFVISSYIIIMVTICHLTEETSEAFEAIHNKLCASNWPYWSIKNRKLLLIVLPNTLRRLEISLAGWICVDYQFLLKGVKLCYTLVTMALNITH